jgi:uncharacterized protein YcbK (DUF882 family)
MASPLSPTEKTNIQATKNFKVSELEFYDVVPPEFMANAVKLLENLQVIRDAANAPITIISGYRSAARNAAVGGKDKSLHLQGAAADIKIKGMTSTQVHTLISKLIKEGKVYDGGLGVYNDFCHYDVRGEHTGHKPGARWDERSGPVK